jgi:crossover junction endodeoxyribonuclease RuvC
MTQPESRLLACDLSLTCSGLATDHGTLTIKPKSKGAERLDAITNAVMSHVMTGYTELVAIEGYAYSMANQAHQMGELGGCVRLALWRSMIPTVVVPPALIKMYATGKGNAKKDEVLVAGVRYLGLECGNDEMDAAWLRALVLDAMGEPLVKMPLTHRRAVSKVTLT